MPRKKNNRQMRLSRIALAIGCLCLIGLTFLSAHSAHLPISVTKSAKKSVKSVQTSSLTNSTPVIPSFRKNLDSTIGYKGSTTSLSTLLVGGLALTPQISISPTTGTLGVTNFTETYSGFTHNGTITENVTYPNGGLTVYNLTANSNGSASASFVLQSQS